MPLPVISIAQMRDWEKATWANGQSEAEVIRLVGRSVARHALQLTKAGDSILILAGKGHNGEDARCAREHLKDRRVNVLEVTSPEADITRLEAELSLRPGLIIDGLFGIGINRPLGSEWVRFLERVNQSHCRILAVDVPSGLNADSGEPEGTAIRASITVTVGAPKIGLLKESAWPFVGRLEIADEVGLISCTQRSELQWMLQNDFVGFPPERQVSTHKGSYGHLAVIAGSRGYHGASVLAARGAQRSQTGLITLWTQEAVYSAVASQLQAVMVSPWRAGTEFASSTTALLAGPGLAAPDVPEDLKEIVRQYWRVSPLTVVVDASALAWLPQENIYPGLLRVITPHPGEAARLLDLSTKEVQADRIQALRSLSKRFGDTWVVLKGHQTLIGRSTGEILINSSGNPHLAQGGSGDVLSGYIAGLVAQPSLRSDPLKTICYAVWQHGATADRLQQTRSNWVVEDLLEELGRTGER